MAGHTSLQRLADIDVPERNLRPEYGSIPNYEALLFGLETTQGAVVGTLVTAVTLDTQTVFPVGRPKAILIVAAGTVTFANGTPTARLYGARTPKAGGQQAGSLITGIDGGFLGPSVPLLAVAGTTLPNGGYWITPSSAAGVSPGIPDLQWDTAHVGLEIVFPGAPTQGTLAIFLYMSPN